MTAVEIRVPRRKVTHVKRDLSGITWAPYYITLECGHQMGGTHRAAHAKAIECWKCHHEATRSQTKRISEA